MEIIFIPAHQLVTFIKDTQSWWDNKTIPIMNLLSRNAFIVLGWFHMFATSFDCANFQ